MLVELAETEGAHGIPIDVNTLGSELQLFIKSVDARQSTNIITSNSLSNYTLSLIKQVNLKEDGHDMQRNQRRK